jgi:hypothetical protein
MSGLEARAVAMAYELYNLLGELFDYPEHGPGSRVERAWDAADDVVSALDPDEREPRLLVRPTELRP